MSDPSAIPKLPVVPLCAELQAKLDLLRRKRNFDPVQWIEERTEQLLTYLERNRLKSCVVSTSGGVDSSCVAGLLKRAQDKASQRPHHPFNPANGGRVVCIAQPFHSTPEVQNRAFEVGQAFGLNVITVDRTAEFDLSIAKVEAALGGPLAPFSKAMCKSYERTPINYLLASHTGGVVVGTGNRDEDGYLFYYCKFGDGAVDVGLIWDLHKSEVYKVGAALGVPNSVLVAPPTADLSPGQTDEEEIGATYDAVELITTYLGLSAIERLELTSGLSDEAYTQFNRELKLIEAIHKRGLHKADLNPKNMGSSWYFANFGHSEAKAPQPELNESYVGIHLTKEDARAIVDYLSWPEERQQHFIAHFDANVTAREEFVGKVELVKSIRAL